MIVRFVSEFLLILAVFPVGADSGGNRKLDTEFPCEPLEHD